MKKIELTQGKFTIVDDEDYEILNKYKWYYVTPIGYAARSAQKNNIRKTILMHRQIMCAEGKMVVDHKNRDKLDNRKSNLRLCSQSQNTMNSIKNTNVSSSKYKGVHWMKRAKLWQIYINVNKKRIHLGYSKCEKEAALIYNSAAIIHHGQYALLNKIDY